MYEDFWIFSGGHPLRFGVTLKNIILWVLVIKFLTTNTCLHNNDTVACLSLTTFTTFLLNSKFLKPACYFFIYLSGSSAFYWCQRGWNKKAIQKGSIVPDLCQSWILVRQLTLLLIWILVRQLTVLLISILTTVRVVAKRWKWSGSLGEWEMLWEHEP